MTFNNHYPSEGKLYYLAHPFEHWGDREKNKLSARAIGNELENLNISLINPILLPLGKTWDKAMIKCLKLLVVCDGIILCPNWCRAKGCKIEFDFAKENGLEIIEIERS
jgi:hypothetical protein